MNKNMHHWIMRFVGNTPNLPLLPSPWLKQRVAYVDVGARGGPPRSWLKLTNQIAYVCFEPDEEEARQLKVAFSANDSFKATVLPKALGAKQGAATLNLTKFRPSSSLLNPNTEVLQRFAVRNFFEVEETTSVAVDTLDSALEDLRSGCDFLKADVQGYELEVLRGAEERLARTCGCELEVSFIEIYQDQPLFAEIDSFMRAHGFFLADLERVWWHYADVPDYARLRGSLAYGNALYLRKDIAEPTDREQLLVNTIICIATGLNELAFRCAAHGRRKGLISSIEEQAFQKWMVTACRHTAFWNNTRSLVSRLPGHQTLSRWLGLLSRSLQGPSPIGADSSSWLRRNSW